MTAADPSPESSIPRAGLPDRRAFLAASLAAGLSPLVADLLWGQVAAAGAGVTAGQPRATLTREMIRAAEQLAGLEFTDAERDLMLVNLENNLANYRNIRVVPLPNHVAPALRFSAQLPGRDGQTPRPTASPDAVALPPVTRPRLDADLAFMTATELAVLLRARTVTPTELTRLYLARLERYDPTLRCVVTLTTDRALRAAAEADRRFAAGTPIGPLDGIPYGVKDMVAVPGYPTTWGAAIYRDRILPETATVVERLDAAGAVLLAKLAMGELGLNDSWYGGQTRNPWQPRVGASGSSSGSAVSVAAGLVGFAIGTETMGSIMTPATRNGIAGLRPTFGRVSRHGVMSLSWSLDKVGVMGRHAEDCALVLEAIGGPDGRDPTVTAPPFRWQSRPALDDIRVGYFRAAFDAPRPGKARDDQALEALRRLGVGLREVRLPTDIPVNSLMIVRVEAAAAFDEFIRSGGLDALVDQGPDGWPNFVRSGRFVPAVEYLQANRMRTLLMERMEAVFDDVDVFVAPTFGVVALTNLTGHPALVVPNGVGEDGLPTSISFIGRPFGENALCALAEAWQQATGWHRRHPLGYEL